MLPICRYKENNSFFIDHIISNSMQTPTCLQSKSRTTHTHLKLALKKLRLHWSKSPWTTIVTSFVGGQSAWMEPHSQHRCAFMVYFECFPGHCTDLKYAIEHACPENGFTGYGACWRNTFKQRHEWLSGAFPRFGSWLGCQKNRSFASLCKALGSSCQINAQFHSLIRCALQQLLWNFWKIEAMNMQGWKAINREATACNMAQG